MIKFAALTFAFLLAAGLAVAQSKSVAKKPQKTTLCHVKGKQPKTIKVLNSDVSEHMAHGDRMGACR
jgi:hypothetical protein